MRNPLLLLLLLLVAAIAAGDCFMPYGPYVAEPTWSADAVTARGVVTQQPVRRGGVVRMTMRMADSGRFVQLSAITDSAAALPLPGDDVVFHSRIEAPHNAGNPGEIDYAAYLRHQGISGTVFCYAGQWRALGPSSSLNLRERMLRQRQRLVGLYAAHFDGETLAILAAMTLGDRTMIDSSTREVYSRTGSSHVLALSGLHLSILVGFLAFFLAPLRRRLGRWGEAVVGVLTLLLVWAFVMLAGLPVSLVRAATMLTVVAVITMFRRSAPPFHALIVATIIMLVVSPTVLFDVGFQLSVVSVAAIEAVARLRSKSGPLSNGEGDVRLHFLPLRLRLESLRLRLVPRSWRLVARRWREASRRWRGAGSISAGRSGSYSSTGPLSRLGSFSLSLLTVSLAAQIATLPLVAHYFGSVSLTGLLAAWIVIPTASLILFGALLFLLLPPLRPVLGVALTWVVSTVDGLLTSLASLPLASVPLTLSWWGVAGVYVFLALLFWAVRCILRGDPRRRFAAIAATILVAFVVAAGEMLMASANRPPVRLAVYNRPARMEIHLTTPQTDSAITTLRDDARHVKGCVVSHGGRTLAVIDRRLPYVADIDMPAPLDVDVLLITKGAQGHLDDMLLRYRPKMVALDACLSDYYRQRFAAEATAAGLEVYDVEARGALLLAAK